MDENNEIYDINIWNINDLINIHEKNQIDYVSMKFEKNAKLDFKKDSVTIKESYIKFNIYNNLILNIKKL